MAQMEAKALNIIPVEDDDVYVMGRAARASRRRGEHGAHRVRANGVLQGVDAELSAPRTFDRGGGTFRRAEVVTRRH